MIDRSIDARKRSFGVAMYDYLSPLSQSQSFYAASDKLTTLVRPILITAQKEIQALAGRRVKQKEELARAETNRAAAFPTKAESVGQQLVNFGKAGYLHSGETKIKTELSVTDRLIKGHKESFGVALFDSFAKAEDEEGFLPTDRQIRNVYDTCRGDVDGLEKQKKTIDERMRSIGGRKTSETLTAVSETSTTTIIAQQSSYSNPSYGSSGDTAQNFTTKAPAATGYSDPFSNSNKTTPLQHQQQGQQSPDLLLDF